MTIAIAGATGHLGRLAVKHLIDRGVGPADIVAGGRNRDALESLRASGVTARQLDFDDASTLDPFVDGIDTLVLISSSAVGQRARQHGAVLDAARRAGVGHVVYTSAPRATTSSLVLAPEHKATEELIHDLGIPFTVLRNNWYNENYEQALSQAATNGVYLASTGAGRTASASRSDYAEAIAAVVTTGDHLQQTYELAGDTAWDGDEFAAAASSALGRKVEFRSVDSEEHAAILTAAGLDPDLVGFLVRLDADIAAGLLDGPSPVLSDLIGHPTTTIEQSSRQMAAHRD